MNKEANPLRKLLERHVLKVCPKSGNIVGIKAKAWWFFPFLGIPALVWFLLRVVPKPSRLGYPCQQIAAPIAGSFLLWLLGICGATFAFRNIRLQLRLKHYGMAIGFLIIGAGWLVMNASFHPGSSSAAVPGYSSEGPNKPIGTATGLFPGRVVWVHDSAATKWDGISGNWWTDASTDQAVVDRMMSSMLKAYTNTASDSAAWVAIFKSFNSTHGRGSNGYQSGEKIVIKINANPDNGGTWGKAGYASPHVVYALISHLITVVGVRGTDITVADPSRYVGDPIYNKIRANSNAEFKNVWFAEKEARSTYPQRIYATPDLTSALWVKLKQTDEVEKKYYLPKCYTAATYLINFVQFRTHRVFGVTLASKNHMGSIFDGSNYTPGALHDFAVRGYKYPNKMGTRHCNPYLTGHKELGGKTLVYLMDGLYTAKQQGGDVKRWSTYGNDWCSSLFVSQDPVALESVGLDAICSEPNLTAGDTTFWPEYTPHIENFLHEMALAANPPSGTVYDPEKDGTRLASLGAHEHWNNATDKKYSRNLSAAGTGIELIMIDPNLKVAVARSGSLTPTSAVSRIESVQFESGRITIGYTISSPDKISVEILDMRGRVVAKGASEFQSAGFHLINVNPGRSIKQSAIAGRAVVRLKTSKGSVTKTVAAL